MALGGGAGWGAEGEFVVVEGGAAAVGGGEGGEDVVAELGVGVGAGVPVGDVAIDGGHFFEGEFADVVPFVAEVDLMEVESVVADDATGVVGGGLFGVEVEPDGGGEGEVADADVHEPDCAVEIDAEEDVGAGGGVVAGTLPADAGADGGGVEAEGLEDPEEVAVLLEAVATAVVVDELALDGGEVEGDGAAHENVEILKGDGEGLGEGEATKGGEGDVAGAVVTDAGEVGGEIDLGRGHDVRMIPNAKRDAMAKEVGRGRTGGGYYRPAPPFQSVAPLDAGDIDAGAGGEADAEVGGEDGEELGVGGELALVGVAAGVAEGEDIIIQGDPAAL